ncbi:hypothetical protein [Photobacterium nomapromontoriensis]|uniref:hypothetical protein n=1 Tax=Photobacterium nomapromontoriensis TaxID=2910237 RepID=UPI003D0ACE12
MKKNIITGVLFAFIISGCVQLPTSTSSTVDSQASISFSSASDNIDLSEYTIYIDGLNMGSADQYITTENVLRIIPGTHIIEIRKNNEIKTKEQFFIGDDVTKGFTIR